ncbi:hypothetical protein KSS87_006754 [Heliosperma pusillum]|nr:hypothetical protein KSS87_006754 [Heliosperma pusillum]
MALLYRIKEMKSINLLNNFKRFYFQIHTPRLSLNQTSQKPILDYYDYIRFTNAPKNQGFCDSRVRFFAAPVQVVKKEVKEYTRPRLNDEIKADFVRLVTDEGHTVVSRREALHRAKELKFDLVEVDRNSNPIVCRLMDYNKEMYNKKVKGKELAKIKSAGSLKKAASKEVRFSAKAELKDIQIKADTVKRLMERGYRVKCTVLAVEGRDLNALLSQITGLIEDVAFVEFGPKIDEKQGLIIVRHIKFGLPKKGNKSSSKVSSKVSSPTNSEIQSQSSTCSNSPVESEELFALEDVDYDDVVSDVDLDNEVKVPLQYQQVISPPRSNDVMGTYKSQSPNFPPNVTPAPQVENRYAKKVLNNVPPMRTPHSQGFQPVVPRQAGSEGSSPRNSWPRQNANSQHRGEIPNGARQTGNNFSPHIENPRPPSFSRGDVPKSTSFGQFSGVKPSNGRFEPGVEVNQQVSKEFSFRDNINPSTFNSNGCAADGNKKWGMFSGEKSVPGRNG